MASPMNQMSIESALRECWEMVEVLRKQKAVNKATIALLRERTTGLRIERRTLRYRSPEQREWLVNDVLCIRSVVRQIAEYDASEWQGFSRFGNEICDRLFGSHKVVDFFVVEWPSKTSTLRCDFHINPDDVSFILLASPQHDYQGDDLLPLVAHEMAHMHPFVSRFDSMRGIRAKKRESLADFLGLNMVGPAFAYAVACYAIEILGLSRFQNSSSRHPSFACRISILHTANEGLWENVIIEKWIAAHLSKVGNVDGIVPPTEEVLHTKCLRELDKAEEDFAKFKISETQLADIAENHPVDLSGSVVLALNAHAYGRVT